MANLSDPDRKRLWARSGNQCTFSGCRQELVDSGVATAPHGVVVGEEAHIVSEADDGPRCDPDMPVRERNAYANIILLCPTHHTLIDKEEGVHFSVELLRQMKQDHERMVDAGQTRTEYGVTHENMALLVSEWAAKAHLDDWPDWTTPLLDVQPTIDRVRFRSLKALAEWLLARHWPSTYPGTARSMANFLWVLIDFTNYFSAIGHGNGDELQVQKYYHHAGDLGPADHAAALRRFDEETRVVGELIAELTRAANFVCDEVRHEVDDQFRLLQGKILVRVPSGFGVKIRRLEYSPDERDAQAPYPGLREFADVRTTRDFYFPGPGRFEPPPSVFA